jgi:Tfp pilus assembly protein PilV
MNKRFFIKNKSGQILIETMVALGMVVIGVLGLLSLLSSSIGINKVVSDQYVASYLASEGIEIVKNIIDNNVVENQPFNNGLLNCQPPAGCRAQYDDYELSQDNPNEPIKFYSSDNSSDLYRYAYQYSTGDDTSFVRVITVSEGTIEDELVVHSIVNWTTRGGAQSSIDLEDHFYNWRR